VLNKRYAVIKDTVFFYLDRLPTNIGNSGSVEYWFHSLHFFHLGRNHIDFIQTSPTFKITSLLQADEASNNDNSLSHANISKEASVIDGCLHNK